MKQTPFTTFLPLPSFTFSFLPPFPSLPFPPFLYSPLRSSPLNPARGLGSAASSPSGVWDEAPAEVEFGAF